MKKIWFTTGILGVLVLIFLGCSDKSTNSTGPNQSSLLVSRLVVSMVPGASETVTVCSRDNAGNYIGCQVSNSDPSIATAAVTDSTIQITGVALGTAQLTITNAAGKSSTLPVQVYDPFVLDTGELQITFTDQFQLILSYVPPGWSGLYVYKPLPPEGYSSLGSFGTWDNAPNGRQAAMVVKARPGSDAIAFTTNYQSTAGMLHIPIPPAGYKAMGQVWTQYGQSPGATACIREDLTTRGAAYMFWSYENNIHQYESAWTINQTSASYHESAYLVPGTFMYAPNLDGPPSDDPLLNILKVELPMLAEAPYQYYSPTLPGYGAPEDATTPMLAKAMLVPCTIVRDAQYESDMPWRIANSPFYRLERQVYYKFLAHRDNSGGSIPQPLTYSTTVGVSQTQSQTVWNETGVELSMSAGISIYAVEAMVTATVSRSFGYERMNSLTELTERTISNTINVPPGKSMALWQQYNRYVLYRHNGIHLEEVTSWEFGIDSYASDEYPNEGQ